MSSFHSSFVDNIYVGSVHLQFENRWNIASSFLQRTDGHYLIKTGVTKRFVYPDACELGIQVIYYYISTPTSVYFGRPDISKKIDSSEVSL